MHRQSEGSGAGVSGGSSTPSGAIEEIISVPLAPHHNVSAFKSRSKGVQKFLTKNAASWQTARACRVFVFENPDNKSEVLAYYTLSSSALGGPQIPESDRVGFPSYVRIPMAQLGHMGRHDVPATKGVGTGILYDAALRVARSRLDVDSLGIWLTPDAAGGQTLQDWYKRWGFDSVLRDPEKPNAQVIMYSKLEPLIEALRPTP
jgi:hypothetical protein